MVGIRDVISFGVGVQVSPIVNFVERDVVGDARGCPGEKVRHVGD